MTAPAADWVPRVAQARALLFDFDGTLAPNLDLPDLRRRVVSLTLAHGVPEAVISGRYIVEIVDAGAAWLAARDTAQGSVFHADGHGLIRDFEIEAARRTEPYADIRPLLAGLRDRGKALAVVTRNCRAAVLAAFPDVTDYCDAVLARDDVAHLKPDVRHVRQALEVVGHEPHQAVMVGDGQLDMRMGRALGLYCVGVLTGSSDADRLREAGGGRVPAIFGLTAGGGTLVKTLPTVHNPAHGSGDRRAANYIRQKRNRPVAGPADYPAGCRGQRYTARLLPAHSPGARARAPRHRYGNAHPRTHVNVCRRLQFLFRCRRADRPDSGEGGTTRP